MAEPILEASGLARRFGGLQAVDRVDVALTPGMAHCVIGPNGAGKTTLINLLSGDLKPDTGTVHFGGRDIAGWPTHRVARLGIARLYQKTNLFPELTVGRNAWLAAYGRRETGMTQDAIEAAAAEALAEVGLAERRDIAAGILSHGEQRQLELALMLAGRPAVLLLDEPMAGMSADETRRMVTLLNRLKHSRALLLIEHDMDAVFAVADRITVMVNGGVLESGLPDQIRRSERVRTAYLGEVEAA
jgi:branched-chain amino acid transport system ATP-binding protein